jgi:hypothetical protein
MVSHVLGYCRCQLCTTKWTHIRKYTGKGKGTPYILESPEGGRGIGLLSLDLDARRGGQRHAPAALPPEKTRYPLYRRLGGPQGRSGRVRKISPYLDSSPDCSACSQSLYRLSYPGPRKYICLNRHKQRVLHIKTKKTFHTNMCPK